MRLYVQGTDSPEFPLRLLNLLALQGAVVEHVTMDMADSGYDVLVNTIAMPPERNTLVVEKIRSMVLVSNVVVLEDKAV